MEPDGIVVVFIQYDALGTMILLTEDIQGWTVILCLQTGEMEEHIADDIRRHRLMERGFDSTVFIKQKCANESGNFYCIRLSNNEYIIGIQYCAKVQY